MLFRSRRRTLAPPPPPPPLPDPASRPPQPRRRPSPLAEEGHPSRYVKLTKDQDAPGEDIRPGELNQPVHVPQLEGRRCGECSQVLPESYEPPADEPWSNGIFGCTDDPESWAQCWSW